MENNFQEGFEKVAVPASALIAGVGLTGILAALGAASGHLSHVERLTEAAKHGKKPDANSWIAKNPKFSGALSLGVAPGLSAYNEKVKLIRDNSTTRRIVDEYPVASRILGNS